MNSGLSTRAQTLAPVCSGTGLIALDVLIRGRSKSWPATVGGSCANVLTILSYLGWESYPIAYLGDDEAAKLILRDFARWRVKTSFVSLGRKGGTPIIIERLEREHGLASHKFEFTCPNCNSRLPRNRPVPLHVASKLMPNLPKAAVFYFDRVSRSALQFASLQRRNGSLIVFEPASLRTDGIFQKCLRIAHVVKYSYEQIEKIRSTHPIPLEIQTLGAEGLRYRYSLSVGSRQEWQKLPIFHVFRHVDSAGAVDWCTAGIIHFLGRFGAKSLEAVPKEQLEYGLKFGQALAALNCSYEGPRGLMYQKTSTDALREIALLLNGNPLEQSGKIGKARPVSRILHEVCPSCASKPYSKVAAIKLARA